MRGKSSTLLPRVFQLYYDAGTNLFASISLQQRVISAVKFSLPQKETVVHILVKHNRCNRIAFFV